MVVDPYCRLARSSSLVLWETDAEVKTPSFALLKQLEIVLLVVA